MPGWFDTFTQAIESGEATYLRCSNCGHASLPPRETCPECGSTTLSRTPLPERGEIRSFTEISVTVPKFVGTTPYTVVLVGFEGGVSLTGQLRGAAAADVSIGDTVEIGVEPADDSPSVIVFRPASA